MNPFEISVLVTCFMFISAAWSDSSWVMVSGVRIDTTSELADYNNDGEFDIDEDFNGNGTPDSFEDFNGNGTPDSFEDFNGNGIPDAFEDFNGNGIPDAFEDFNDNGIPDAFEDMPDDSDDVPELFEDNNSDGYPDFIVLILETIGNSVTLETPLREDTTYSWKVVGINSSGLGVGSSDVWSFTTFSLQPFGLSLDMGAPDDMLSWQSSLGRTYYIYSTTNLLDWPVTPWTNLPGNGGILEVPIDTNAPARFFKVIRE